MNIERKVISLHTWKAQSYEKKLKRFYRRLDETQLGHDVGSDKRNQFVRQMKGEFIRISKFKLQKDFGVILDQLDLNAASLIGVENGWIDIKDRDFFLLITYLGCSSEIFVFFEKMEKALVPGLRETRAKYQSTLLSYGLGFADKSKN